MIASYTGLNVYRERCFGQRPKEDTAQLVKSRRTARHGAPSRRRSLSGSERLEQPPWPLANRYLSPPDTSSVSPVMYFESDDARYTAVGEMSSGCPMRPSGACVSTIFWKSLPTKPAACTPSVSIIPGLIEFTRIPRGPSSFASTPVMASTAAFVAVYTVELGGRIELAPEPMLMMLPPSAPMCFTASFVVNKRPRTLRSNCLWNRSSVTP